MTPHRSHHRGTFVIDRCFGPVGRICRASGTTDADVCKRLNLVLTELYAMGRLDLLRALRDRVLHPLELYNAFRQGQLDHLPTAEDLKPLAAAIAAWLPRLDATKRTRDRYEDELAKLTDGRAQATVADLPKLLAEQRAKCQGTGQRRTFNMIRAGAQAFTRDVLGREHRLWRAVTAVARLRESPRKGNPLSVEKVYQLAGTLGGHGPVLWSLCLSGMRSGEYWSRKWEHAGDRILVHGTKTAGADRFVPFVQLLATPATTYWGFAQALNKATGGHVRPHDTRKTFANWAEQAGIPRTRRRLYLGHGRRDVTDLYEEADVRAFLAEDGERLLRFIGGDPAQRLRAMQ